MFISSRNQCAPEIPRSFAATPTSSNVPIGRPSTCPPTLFLSSRVTVAPGRLRYPSRCDVVKTANFPVVLSSCCGTVDHSLFSPSSFLYLSDLIQCQLGAGENQSSHPRGAERSMRRAVRSVAGCTNGALRCCLGALLFEGLGERIHQIIRELLVEATESKPGQPSFEKGAGSHVQTSSCEVQATSLQARRPSRICVPGTWPKANSISWRVGP